MRDTLSLLGLYYANDNLFAGLHLPEEVDKDLFVDNLLAECAELECLYTDPDMMEFMVTVWSTKEVPIWEKLAETLHYEYDPLDNYNKYEDWDDTRNASSTGQTASTSNIGTTDSSNNTTTDTTKVAGFNGEELAVRDSVESNGAMQTATNTTQTDNSSNNAARAEAENHTGHIHGNIGVTTTQTLIKEERDIVEFNLIDYIISSFKKRFCLLIY